MALWSTRDGFGNRCTCICRVHDVVSCQYKQGDRRKRRADCILVIGSTTKDTNSEYDLYLEELLVNCIRCIKGVVCLV